MKLSTDTAPSLSERELLAAIKAGVAFVERGDYKHGYTALHAVYGRRTEAQLPSDGLSHYGLSIAVVERQTRKGAELCLKAIDEQFFNSVHFVNLVRLYIIRDNRKAAVEALHEGLSRLPNDRALLRLRDEIGYRQPPVVSFLPRANPINESLGKLRARNTPKPASKKKSS